MNKKRHAPSRSAIETGDQAKLTLAPLPMVGSPLGLIAKFTTWFGSNVGPGRIVPEVDEVRRDIPDAM